MLQQAAQLAIQRLSSDQDLEIDHYGERWGKVLRITSQDLGRGISTTDGVLDDFVLTIQPVDDGGKVNLNLASEALIIATLKTLDEPYRAEAIAEAIIDWRDADAIGPYETGAYQTPTRTFATPNVDFRRSADLLLARGVSPTLYWGEDQNSNGILDPNEDDGDERLPYDSEDGKLNKGLCDVFAARANPEININTASGEVLRGMLNAFETPVEQVELIVRGVDTYCAGPDGVRHTGDDQAFGTMSALQESLGDTLNFDPNLLPIGFHSEQFRFILQIQYNNPHYVRSASLVVGRDSSGEIAIREWVKN